VTSGGGTECWGFNAVGQLGDGTTLDSSVPVSVSGLTNGVISVAGGDDHTCALTSGGGVKCWGYNSDGELGTGTNLGPQQCTLGNNTYACSTTPVQVSGLPGGWMLSVSQAGAGAGSLTSSPVGIDCGAGKTACRAQFAAGSTVTLSAAPAPGSTFAGWSGGGCTGTGACTVTLNADTAVTATFNTTAPPPPPATSTSCTPQIGLRITRTQLTAQKLVVGGATSVACDRLRLDAVAFARVRHPGKRATCSFLTARYRWTGYRTCTHTLFLKANGTSHWGLTIKRRFAKGVYWLWAHAVDIHDRVTTTRISSHASFRLR
jgi:Regulator of chromosome condensation (RCC1) repeat/Divergent InlB B-repeat domain